MTIKENNMEVVLKTEGLIKRFGGLVAVNNVDLSMEKGKVYALIGPNGSGKTTLLNLISGLYKIDDGKIKYLGEEIQGNDPHTICWKGIGRTFQNIRILGSQTVFENALLGKGYGNDGVNLIHPILNTPKYRKHRAECTEEVNETLEFVGLVDNGDELASNLPYGKQKVLEIARALVTNPNVLLLDEPAAGLNSQEIHILIELIEKINEKGLTVLLIEHRMEFVRNLADWVFVLNQGRKVAEGTFDVIKENPEVITAYLGKRRD